MPPNEFDELKEIWIDESWSKTYVRNSNRQFDRFVDACDFWGWNAMPTDERALTNYVLFRYCTSTVIHSSMVTELSGITRALKAFGHPVDRSSEAMPTLSRILRKYEKERPKGSSVKKKRPITTEVLRTLLSPLNADVYDDLTVRAMLCLAKEAMLRVSEYTLSEMGPAPRIRDIEIVEESGQKMLIFGVSKSKMNQIKRSESTVCICRCPDPCAVCEVQNMLDRRKGTNRNQALFLFRDGSIPDPSTVNQLIHDLCVEMGLDPKLFSSHSLRSGGITDLLIRDCCSGQVVALLSRHANVDSLRDYRKPSDEQLRDYLVQHSQRETKKKKLYKNTMQSCNRCGKNWICTKSRPETHKLCKKCSVKQ